MKTLQRILIILAVAALLSLISWAAVNVITVASMPTDTMDYNPPMRTFNIDLGLSFLGIFQSLVPIALIVAVEQIIEYLWGRKRKSKNSIASA